VTAAPAGNVASLRSPAITDAVPPAAPVPAPIAAPLPPPMIRTENCAGHRAAADACRAPVAALVAVSIDRLGRDRQLRAVGQRERVEADAEPRAFAQLAAALDHDDRPQCVRARGNHHAAAHADVANHPGVHAVFHARALAAEGGFRLQSNHRIGRDDEFVERRWRRLGRLDGLWSPLFNRGDGRQRGISRYGNRLGRGAAGPRAVQDRSRLWLRGWLDLCAPGAGAGAPAFGAATLRAAPGAAGRVGSRGDCRTGASPTTASVSCTASGTAPGAPACAMTDAGCSACAATVAGAGALACRTARYPPVAAAATHATPSAARANRLDTMGACLLDHSG